MTPDPALYERMAALCRMMVADADDFCSGDPLEERVYMNVSGEQAAVEEARAIAALLPPEVPIARLEARKLYAAPEDNPAEKSAILAGEHDRLSAIKLLERGIAHRDTRRRAEGGRQMTQAIADVLNRAADLLEMPNAWTGPARNYAGALGADGEWRAAHSTEAVQWSIHAAIFRASGAESRRNGDLCNLAVLAIETHVPGYDADAWERVPGRTQAEVVAMVRSIALRAAAAAAIGGEA